MAYPEPALRVLPSAPPAEPTVIASTSAKHGSGVAMMEHGRIVPEVFFDTSISLPARAVYAVITVKMRDHVWKNCTRSEIAKSVGCGPSRVTTALKELEDAGILTRSYGCGNSLTITLHSNKITTTSATPDRQGVPDTTHTLPDTTHSHDYINNDSQCGFNSARAHGEADSDTKPEATEGGMSNETTEANDHDRTTNASGPDQSATTGSNDGHNEAPDPTPPNGGAPPLPTTPQDEQKGTSEPLSIHKAPVTRAQEENPVSDALPLGLMREGHGGYRLVPLVTLPDGSSRFNPEALLFLGKVQASITSDEYDKPLRAWVETHDDRLPRVHDFKAIQNEIRSGRSTADEVNAAIRRLGDKGWASIDTLWRMLDTVKAERAK